MSKIYVVTERCGTEMGDPQIFYTQEEANPYIKHAIYEDIVADFNEIYLHLFDSVEESGPDIDIKDIDTVIEWGKKEDVCSDNMYMFRDDWHELVCTPRELDMERLAELNDEIDKDEELE